MQQILEYLQQLDWVSILQNALEKLATIATGLVLAWFFFVRQFWRLQAGDTDDILFQAHYLSPKDGKYVLLFRTVAPPTTIKKAYDNIAAQRMIKQLANQTSLDDPVLKSEGSIGFEIVNDLVNYLSGVLAVGNHAREVWLAAVTCEDRKLAPKKCIRVFLIREPDLTRFADWHWCKGNLFVEAPWHFFRIVALHAVARQFQAEKLAATKENAAVNSSRDGLLVAPRAKHERIRRLSLGLPTTELPIGAASLPDWNAAEAYLKGAGVSLPTRIAENVKNVPSNAGA